MSPHAVPPLAYTSDRDIFLSSGSEVESNGFLPCQHPLDVLPDPYYGPWESLIRSLPDLLKDKTIRPRVHELPILDVCHLRTTPEWRRAYVVLSFLAHGYIWGGEHAAEVSSVVTDLTLT